MASEKARAAWPRAKEDVKKALAAMPQMPPQADWSEAVGGMQARLSVERRATVEGASLLATQIELRHVGGAEPIVIRFDLSSLKFDVVDEADKPVPPPDTVDFGGHVVGPWESGADKAFEELKERVKKEFEIDVIITATE